tara:strand:+ start:251 stop:3643 length:3393 start_codon:yes stop_codon:yes gene_type:complete
MSKTKHIAQHKATTAKTLKIRIPSSYYSKVISVLRTGPAEIPDIMSALDLPDNKRIYVVVALKKGISNGRIEKIPTVGVETELLGHKFELVPVRKLSTTKQTHHSTASVSQGMDNDNIRPDEGKEIKMADITSQGDKMSYRPDQLPKNYNEDFVRILHRLEELSHRFGDVWPERAYHKAAESILKYEYDNPGVPITSVSQIAHLPGIGEQITSKLQEYIDTGKVSAIEKRANSAEDKLTQVFKIGAAKAAKLIKLGYTNVEAVRRDMDKPELGLSDSTKIGLLHFEDIQTKIPRDEIDAFLKEVTPIFEDSTPPGSKFQIAGSYRRGVMASGDIDMIITNESGKRQTASDFVEALEKAGVITYNLTPDWTVKFMGLVKVPGYKRQRRLDILWSPPREYPFALLYFTGSKSFNTMQRSRALQMGYTLTQDGIRHMVKGKKGKKVDQPFPTEKAIFDFLNMRYVEPPARKNAQAVIELKPRNTTLKSPGRAKPSEMIDKFKKNGLSYLKELTEADLTAMLRLANTAYYSGNSPVMSDDQYDILREHTLSSFPANETAIAAHADIDMEFQRNKVKLPYEMWSMDKIKADTKALAKWETTYSGPYVLSAKLDGASGMYSTEESEPKLYTRGNGKVGQDVSHLIPFLQLPKENGLVIRGEFIIPKAVFARKYASKFSNPRNLVAGLINSKKTTKAKLEDIDFVAYELIKPEMKPLDQMVALRDSYNVKTVVFQEEKALTNEVLSTLLVDWRENYEYEIDGVICTDNKVYTRRTGNPAHSFAFKMVLGDQMAEVKVTDVIWTASKAGLLKPVVQFEPVVLGGAKIVQATGFNGKFIEENKIGVGATVSIIRSGDVIPHILGVVKPAPEAMMPAVPYEWNASHVDVILKDKESDPTVNRKVIEAFFKNIGAEGLKAGMVKRLVDAGFDTIPKIVRMTKEDFLTLPKVKDKMATKLTASLDESLAKADLPTLMHASNVFGQGFGGKILRSILRAIPDILTSDDAEEVKVDKLKTVDGVAKKTAARFASQIETFMDWLKETGLERKLTEDLTGLEKADTGHELFGKAIVMTGLRDAEKKVLLKQLEPTGAEIQSGITRSTAVVIAADPDGETSKAKKARKMGIPILSVEQFREKYNIVD